MAVSHAVHAGSNPTEATKSEREKMAVFQDPQVIADTIDNEGWPDALGWLYRDQFSDSELNDLILKAYNSYIELESLRQQVKERAIAVGVDWYV